MPGPIRKLRDWLNAADVTAALEQQLSAGMVTIGGSGDVVQIADLPAEVAEAFGINTVTERISRGQAMSIPAMAQARDTVAGTIGTFPLLATRAAGEVAAPRSFLAQPDPRTTRQWLITWTVDDLMFGPVAWWWVDSYDAAGFPATAHRIAPRARIPSCGPSKRMRRSSWPAVSSTLSRLTTPPGRTVMRCGAMRCAVAGKPAAS